MRYGRDVFVLFGVFVLILGGLAPTRASESGLERALLQSTVRIRSERRENGTLITGHGTAFGVDLEQFGYHGRRYLLSAGHNVLDESGHLYADLKVEIPQGAGSNWRQCRTVAYDSDLDLCLLEACADLPAVMQLDDIELGPGNPLVMAGSPRGVPVTVFEGSVMRRFEHGSVRSVAQIPFDHGDSGGPVVCPRTGKVSGVAVAGVPRDGDLDHTLGLFVPLAGIASFLESTRLKNTAAAAAVATPIIKTSEVKKTPPPACAAEAASARQRPAPKHVIAEIIDPPDDKSQAASNSEPAAATAPLLSHCVTAGETLSQIARSYAITLQDLIRANAIKDPNHILIGSKLIIPSQQ